MASQDHTFTFYDRIDGVVISLTFKHRPKKQAQSTARSHTIST